MLSGNTGASALSTPAQEVLGWPGQVVAASLRAQPPLEMEKRQTLSQRRTCANQWQWWLPGTCLHPLDNSGCQSSVPESAQAEQRFCFRPEIWGQPQHRWRVPKHHHWDMDLCSKRKTRLGPKALPVGPPLAFALSQDCSLTQNTGGSLKIQPRKD